MRRLPSPTSFRRAAWSSAEDRPGIIRMSVGRLLEGRAVVGDELRVIEHAGDGDPAMALDYFFEVLPSGSAASLVFSSSASASSPASFFSGAFPRVLLTASVRQDIGRDLDFLRVLHPAHHSAAHHSAAHHPAAHRSAAAGLPPPSPTPRFGLLLAIVGIRFPCYRVRRRGSRPALDKHKDRSGRSAPGITSQPGTRLGRDPLSRTALYSAGTSAVLTWSSTTLAKLLSLIPFSARFWMIFSGSSWRPKFPRSPWSPS